MAQRSGTEARKESTNNSHRKPSREHFLHTIHSSPLLSMPRMRQNKRHSLPIPWFISCPIVLQRSKSTSSGRRYSGLLSGWMLTTTSTGVASLYFVSPRQDGEQASKRGTNERSSSSSQELFYVGALLHPYVTSCAVCLSARL